MNAIIPPLLKNRQDFVIGLLKPILNEDALLWEPEDTIPYECDGLAAYRQMLEALELVFLVALCQLKMAWSFLLQNLKKS